MIDELILHKYIRMSLGDIETLTFTPRKIITIILGTNGCGKSSLLRELSVLPANLNKDYGEDGYKIIKITYKNSKYVLTSGVKKNKHEFIKDGVPLNIGGTKKVQMSLIEEHLGYGDYHDVMIGNKRFTKMSTKERKDWFTLIANTDYEYALKTFHKAKQHVRDLNGALKILRTKLPTEEIKVEDAILISNKERLQDLNIVLENLYLNKEIIHETDSSFEKRLVDSLDRLESYKKALFANDVINITKQTDIDVAKRIAIIENENLVIPDKIKQNEIDVKNISEKINLSEVSKESLEQDIVKANNKKELLLEISGIPEEDIMFSAKAFNNIYLELRNRFYELSEFFRFDIKVNREIVTGLKNNLPYKESSLKKMENKIIEETLFLESQEEKKSHMVTCGKCNHQWALGFDVKKYNDTLISIESNKVKKGNLEEEIRTIKNKLEKIQKYFNTISDIKDIATIDKHVYKYVLRYLEKAITDKSIIYTTDLLLEDNEMFSKCLEIDNINNEIRNKTVKLELLKSRNIEDKHYLEKRQSQLISLGNSLVSTLFKNRTELSKLNRVKFIIEAIEKERENIDDYFSQNKKFVVNRKKELYNTAIDGIINMVKSEIVTLEEESNKILFFNNTIEDYKRQIVEMEKEEKVAKLIAKVLSPNEGLIAKSVTGFLKQFTEEINNIISSIWSYELKVLPCDIENNTDLDYKFPVKVADAKPVDDVNETSESMNEIINLAFVIVSMKYLKLEDYPLYLDEFTRTMDIVHKNSAFNVVEKLADTTFKQIFIVSHFESVFKKFDNKSDLVVLNQENIFLDNKKIINEVIEIV